MIAKAKWFSARKYGGWGLTPNCWQGWVYILVMVLPMLLISSLNLPTWLMTFWAFIFCADIVDVMIHIKRDERETIHEALAERNAMWFMVAALAVGVAFQAATSVVKDNFQVDPVILVALVGATIVKALSHWYFRNK
jgi:hypothetical protein